MNRIELLERMIRNSVEMEKNQRLRSVYGIGIREYDKMLRRQGFACAICRKPDEGRTLFVDHDHATGHIRGLLCRNCNTAAGWFERVDMVKVAMYLSRPTYKWRVKEGKTI
jgi:predicted RecB family nuclease